MYRIIPAQPSDAGAITALTLRSKAFWGYSHELIESWREELTITPDYIRSNPTVKCVDEEALLGFYTFNALDKITVKLNFLFIEPNYIGKGIGGRLMDHFKKQVSNGRYKRVILDADPHAQAFYQKHGFKVIDQLPSSIEGRFLPIMEWTVEVD